MSCECLPDCPFFHDRMKNMPTAAGVLKQQYCLDDWSRCARCTVFRELGREAVPPDLFPYETERAAETLDVHRDRVADRAPGRDTD